MKKLYLMGVCFLLLIILGCGPNAKFNEAENLRKAKKLDDALNIYNKINEKYQAPEVKDRVNIGFGSIYEDKGDFIQAIVYYKKVTTKKYKNDAITAIQRCDEKLTEKLTHILKNKIFNILLEIFTIKSPHQIKETFPDYNTVRNNIDVAKTPEGLYNVKIRLVKDPRYFIYTSYWSKKKGKQIWLPEWEMELKEEKDARKEGREYRLKYGLKYGARGLIGIYLYAFGYGFDVKFHSYKGILPNNTSYFKNKINSVVVECYKRIEYPEKRDGYGNVLEKGREELKLLSTVTMIKGQPEKFNWDYPEKIDFIYFLQEMGQNTKISK